MEKLYYSADSLERSLLGLETKWNIRSDAFYKLCIDGKRVPDMPGFTRSVWASLYRDFCRLRGDDSFSVAVGRALELA